MALDPEIEAYRKNLPRHQFYLIFTERCLEGKAAEDAHQQNLKAHYAWLADLDHRGLLFAAGPLRDASGTWDGSGMFIVKATSREDAQSLAETEPMHAQGIRKFRIVPWQLNEGGFTIRVSHASGRFSLSM
ncbi:MAG TPA: YciI family protein [Xanthobacteraceae bacterium]|jgi:uncharacterized protein YciI|nr:YciI family protein [Xanthobacteraceae bacterium]